MSYPQSEQTASRAGGRPRDAGVERRILTAVMAVLAESGYDGLTFEAVARRSATSKATLYRRWKTRRDMVIAALRSGAGAARAAEVVDTGSLRGDLAVLVRRLDDSMRSAGGRTALLLLQAGLEDPELCDAIETSVGPTGARLPATVLADAVARNELPPGADPFAYEEIVGSVLLLRRLNGLLVDDDYLDTLIDSVVVPSLIASTGRPRPHPAGIFSGAPAPHPDRPDHATSRTETP